MADDARIETLIPFLQQQGVVWGPSPELYGGVAGFYTYGPIGTLLKRNVENKIRSVFAKNEFFEIETPTILPKEVWKASGHLDGFTDPLIADKKGNVYRADKVLEEHYGQAGIEEPIPTTPADILAAIKKHGLTSPAGEPFKQEIKQHNLMMQTTIGTDQEAYNRPETATATYLPFLRSLEFFRKKLPFGVYQIGKAYRNEISPRQHLLRMREFTQAEAQLYIDPEKKDGFEPYNEVKKETLPVWSWEQQTNKQQPETIIVEQARKKHFSSDAYSYTVHLAINLFRSFGIPEERIRLRQHGPEEKAFYAADAWDVEINLPTFGWYEVCGVHDRTNYDLTQHGKASGNALEAFIEARREKVVPHVLEIAFGVDRPVFALLDIYYEEKKESEGKTMLRIPKKLAPIQATVLPLTKKLRKEAQGVYNQLLDEGFVATYDESGSIGKRYLRASTIGTPYCITIDYDTQEDEQVTVRDRDTEEQQRIPIKKLSTHLKKLFR